MLMEILEICVIPILGILTKYLVDFLNAKREELNIKAHNERYQKYINIATDTIIACVTATNQTYVESLKKSESFDKEAQKKAFEQTYLAVLKILNQETKDVITEITGDLEAYITAQIEAVINAQKK